MKMKQGWISIHRQLQSHWLWDEKPFSKGQAWVDLLMLANHEDVKMPYKGEIITCKRGDVNRSILQLSERWGWSRGKTRDFLKLLENDEMVTVNATTHRTTITIVKYEDFAYKPTTKSQQKANKKPAKSQQADTNNNDNNENNENKIIYVADAQLNQAIISFVAFREKIKKPMTDDAIDLLIKKLQKMTPNVEKQIEIINQSILNGWQGVFPLKEEKKQTVTNCNRFNNAPQRNYEMDALERMLLEQQNYKPETDAGFLAEAEALQKELQQKYGR